MRWSKLGRECICVGGTIVIGTKSRVTSIAYPSVKTGLVDGRAKCFLNSLLFQFTHKIDQRRLSLYFTGWAFEQLQYKITAKLSFKIDTCECNIWTLTCFSILQDQKQQEKLAFEQHLVDRQKEHTQLLLLNTSRKENILNSVRQVNYIICVQFMSRALLFIVGALRFLHSIEQKAQ